MNTLARHTENTTVARSKALSSTPIYIYAPLWILVGAVLHTLVPGFTALVLGVALASVAYYLISGVNETHPTAGNDAIV